MAHEKDDEQHHPTPASPQTPASPSAAPSAPADAARAQQERDARAVGQEMAHQERMKETGGQDQGLDEPATPPPPQTSPATVYETPVQETENIVDTTHWPEALRQFMANLVQPGQKLRHEGQDYDVIMKVGGRRYLVADASGQTKVIEHGEA